MSSNNYNPNNIRGENQGYTFNGIPTFFPQCNSESAPSNYVAGQNIGIGISAPGTHIEDTPTPNIAPPPVIKSSNRGRRKQKKKSQCNENNALKSENTEECNSNLNEAVPLSGLQDGVPSDMYSGLKSNSSEETPQTNPQNQFLLNSNTIDRILSYKKVLILESPEVIELLQKHLKPNNSEN